MRLPVSKAYRAFKELDRFSDTQCVTFARAARPRGWRWLGHAIVILTVTVVGLIGMMAAAYFGIIDRFFRNSRFDGPAFYLAILPMMAVAIGIGPLMGYMTRDFFLRRGIRRVLISRGSCCGCRYTITGLAVDDEARVKCPECGAITIADSSLGEIVNDEKGGRIFLPSPEAAEAAWPVFFSRVRVMRWVKRVAVTLAVLVISVVSFVAWWEWSVRQQAAAALATRDTNAFLDYSLSQQAEGAEGESENGFDVITKISADLSRRMQTGMPAEVWTSWGVDLGTILNPEAGHLDPQMLEERKRMIVDSMAALKRAGAFEPMNQLKSVRRAVHDPLPAPGQSVIGWTPLEYAMNPLRSVNMTRMYVASEANDLDEFAAAAEVQLAVARLCVSGATSDVVGNGQRMQVATLHLLLREIVARRDPKWIDTIEALVARQQRPENPNAMIDLRRLALRDYVCVYFSDLANFRFGRFTPIVRQMSFRASRSESRLGSFNGNIRAIERWHKGVKEAISAPDANWSKIVKITQQQTPLMLINALGGFDGRELILTADVILYREALRAVIAIERHRLETGAPPARLEDLVPSRLATMPRDPWSGGVLNYRLEVKGRDPEGCGYVLYSAGRDGGDQGGAVPQDAQRWWVYVYGMPGNSGAADVVLSP
jgi:hypothetical protein